jgi:hypothetical protein
MKNDIRVINVKELRKFSFIMALLISIIFGILSPYLRHNRLSILAFGIAAVFVIWPFISIKSLKIFYTWWNKLSHVLGWINTRLILGLIFYLLFAPIGVMARLCGYDPLKLKYDSKTDTYRETSEIVSRERMEVPF